MLGKNRRLALNEVKPNVYRDNLFLNLVDWSIAPTFYLLWRAQWLLCLLGFAALSANLQKHATAPGLQLPICSIDRRGGAPNGSIGTVWPSYAQPLSMSQPKQNLWHPPFGVRR